MQTATTKKQFGHDRFVVTKARYVRMLAPFISKEETRYHLEGIHFESNGTGVVAVATDGHRMGIVHDVAGKLRGSWICPVSKSFLNAAAKAQRDDHDLAVVFAGDEAHLVPSKLIGRVQGAKSAASFSTHSESLAAIDGTFPEWPRVLPKKLKNRHRPMHLNAAYVADFNKVANAAALSRSSYQAGRGWQFFQTGGEMDPLIIRNAELPEFVGVLMPMRLNHIDPLPEWLPSAA